jgi:hypothetical protein
LTPPEPRRAARSPLPRVLVAAVGIGAGAAAMHLLDSAHAPSPQAALAAPPSAATEERPVPVVIGPVSARLSDDDKHAIARMVREELGALQPAPASAADSGAAPPENDRSSPSSPAVAEARERVRVAVEQGIARGTWTDEDVMAMREAMVPMSGQDRVDAIRPLVIAVNEGRVRRVGRGPLF